MYIRPFTTSELLNWTNIFLSVFVTYSRKDCSQFLHSNILQIAEMWRLDHLLLDVGNIPLDTMETQQVYFKMVAMCSPERPDASYQNNWNNNRCSCTTLPSAALCTTLPYTPRWGLRSSDAHLLISGSVNKRLKPRHVDLLWMTMLALHVVFVSNTVYKVPLFPLPLLLTQNLPFPSLHCLAWLRLGLPFIHFNCSITER